MALRNVRRVIRSLLRQGGGNLRDRDVVMPTSISFCVGILAKKALYMMVDFPRF